MKLKILFLALGIAVCGPALAVQEQQQAPAMTVSSAMPTYDISLFSHKFHVDEAGFTCTDCHNSLFQKAAGTAKAAGDFNMAAFGKGKYCGTCHDGSTAFPVTDQDSCVRCHGTDMKPLADVVFTQPVKAVVFEHNRHVNEFGMVCDSCHPKLFTAKKGESEKLSDFTMESMYNGKYCGACHDGASAFSAKTRCTLCHIGKKGYNRLFANKQQEEDGHSEEQ